jgi:hypothetical protein
MYIKQINKKDESVEEDEVPFEETTKTDPFDAYAESMDRIAEYDVALDEEPNEGNEFSGALAKAKMDGKEEFEVDGKTYKVKEEVDEAAKPDFLDLDGDGDKKEPMKKAAKDKKKGKEENISERVMLDPEGISTINDLLPGYPSKPKPKPNSGYTNIGGDDDSGYTNIGGAKADPIEMPYDADDPRRAELPTFDDFAGPEPVNGWTLKQLGKLSRAYYKKYPKMNVLDQTMNEPSAAKEVKEGIKVVKRNLKPKTKPKPNSGYKNMFGSDFRTTAVDDSGYKMIRQPGERDPDPLNIRGGLSIPEYMKKHGIEDTTVYTTQNMNKPSAAKEVKEGTWHIADDMSGLQELIASGPIPAKDAIDMIRDYIGEDDLYDAIGNLEDMDPNADARYIIRDFLESGDIGYDTFEEVQAVEEDDDIARLKKTAGIGYKNIGDVKDTSGYTNIGGAKADPTPNDGVNPGLYPDDPIPTPPTPPIDDDEYPDDTPVEPEVEINPGLYPDPEIGSKEWYKQNQLPPDVAQRQVMVKGKDGKMYGTPHAAILADRVYDYNVKQGKIKPEINIDGDSTFGKMKIQKEDDMAWLRKAAGIGSGAKSNHGIHEGEEGYQITPRSLVAREMRKLQDIAKD